jgi:hypothetical protein
VIFLFTLISLLWSASPLMGLEREVHLEWEKDDEASFYELEIGSKGSTKAGTVIRNLVAPEWTGKLAPGKYWMKVRGRDERDLAGDWSQTLDFQVKLGFAEATAPAQGETVKATESSHNLTLEWKPVAGAQAYSVVVLDDKNGVVETKKTKMLKMTLNVASAAKYSWFVQAVDETGYSGERPPSMNEVTVMGEAPTTPTLRQPESKFVRRIEFDRPKEAAEVKVTITRFDPEKKDWVTLAEHSLKKANFVPLLSKWPGGRYQVSAVGVTPYRPNSQPSEINFEVAQGARSVAAENRALIRKSIERTDGWFGTASYAISQISYGATVVEENSSTSLNALTGSALVGAGKFWTDSPLGAFGSLDFGGISVGGTNTTFFGLEGSGLYRIRTGHSGDFRLKAGLFWRQIPQIVGLRPSVEVETFATMGPALGAEYWHSLTPKLCLQGSLDLKYVVGAKSATGQQVENTPNYSLGLMGGYRLKPNMTGLLGYTYRAETYQFKGLNPGLATEGTNKIELTGHFLKLLLEYDF